MKLGEKSPTALQKGRGMLKDSACLTLGKFTLYTQAYIYPYIYKVYTTNEICVLVCIESYAIVDKS